MVMKINVEGIRGILKKRWLNTVESAMKYEGRCQLIRRKRGKSRKVEEV